MIAAGMRYEIVLSGDGWSTTEPMACASDAWVKLWNYCCDVPNIGGREAHSIEIRDTVRRRRTVYHFREVQG